MSGYHASVILFNLNPFVNGISGNTALRPLVAMVRLRLGPSLVDLVKSEAQDEKLIQVILRHLRKSAVQDRIQVSQ